MPTLFYTFVSTMIRYFFIFAVLYVMLSGCNKTDDEKAAALLADIDSLCSRGCYCETLDSIVALRSRFPAAVEARKKALVVWQTASLKMAQKDIAHTDSLLQATIADIAVTTDLYKANMLRVRRDSLKARYEAMCGVVRMIHMRQKQNSQADN